MRLAALADTPQEQIAERPARLEHRLMLIPGLVDDLGGGQLPAALADVRPRRNAAARIGRTLRGDEPYLGFLLPVPVGGQLDKASQTRFAFVHRAIGALLDRPHPPHAL